MDELIWMRFRWCLEGTEVTLARQAQSLEEWVGGALVRLLLVLQEWERYVVSDSELLE